jgi:tyrosyl-tRNA synthetase
MTLADVQKNAETYLAQIKKIFVFDGPNPARIAFNSTWLKQLSFADVISLAAKFTVQQMIERDMYQNRLKEGKPIFLHEFFYPLMQGYDSVAMEVDGEFGGSDQLFNMMAGRQLMLEMVGKEKFVITGKLLVGNDGRKMSKSYNNYIAFSDEPNNMYGKVMSVKDELMEEYFMLCTDMEIDQIKSVMAQIKAQTMHPRDAKMILARAIVTIYHGQEAAANAEKAFVNQFQAGAMPENMAEVVVDEKTMRLADLLVTAGLATSTAEAKRLIKSGAVRIDGVKANNDIAAVIALDDSIVLQVGKLKYRRIRKKPSKA